MNNQRLRFCYECRHFIKKNGVLAEYFCEINTQLRLNQTSEANQCIDNGFFDDITA